ncbi:MAG: hypothetical protein IKO10_16190 [Lachnospiraceae bacterium]|nr:hypothetical protein [Lachnospiraceae bacterium]
MIYKDNEKPRIFFDMDGTLAEWRNITLTIESDEDRYKVMQILNEILLTPGYFSTLEPHQNMLDAMEILNDKYEVYILSCAIPKDGDPSPAAEKTEWLGQHAPYLKPEQIVFVPDGQDKSRFIPGGIRETDFLVDDYTKNLIDFDAAGGCGIKAMNFVNGTKGRWNGSAISITSDPKDIADSVEMILKGFKIRQDAPQKKQPITSIDKDTDVRKLAEDIGLVKE